LIYEHLLSARTPSLQAAVLFAEQLLQENGFYESGAAASERPPLENTFLFPARTLSTVKSILFIETLLIQNKFCDTLAAVCGNPLFQNSFSVCSSRMLSRQYLVLREQLLRTSAGPRY